jgi:hypothetical protein
MARTSRSGTVAPSTRRGLAVVFGLVLIVGLAVFFTVLSFFTGPVIKFLELLIMAAVGFAYPRIAGLAKKEPGN